MNKDTNVLTSLYFKVYFEDPFYIAICEKVESNGLSVCKIIFGAEPKDYEVYEYILKHWYELCFSPTIKDDIRTDSRINPKRLQRNVKKQVMELGVGTKSWQALKLLQESRKVERKLKSREKRDEEKERQFILKQQKKKDKHKGR